MAASFSTYAAYAKSLGLTVVQADSGAYFNVMSRFEFFKFKQANP